MSQQSLSVLIVVVLASLAAQTPAFAWGDFAHEKANEAATQLFASQKHPLSAILEPQAAVLVRLAKTPDVDWKWTTEKQGKKTARVAVHDEAFHFFMADAFVNPRADENAILSLPTSLDEYAKLLATTAERRKDYFEAAPSSNPKDYGVAPWRVLQLYDLAIESLKARAIKPALFYFGVLGHYVADLAQPFQTTLNSDGQVYALPVRGIHDAFGKAIFETKGVRANFNATQAARNALGTRGLDGLTRDRIVPELFKLVNSGYAFLDPLLKTYAEQARGNVEAFAKANAYHQWTTAQIAESRLGEAAMLTARIWASAYREAGSPDLESKKLSFQDLKAADHYPTANFLPSSYK